MKKLISVTLCIFVLCAMLAACDSTEAEPSVQVPDYFPGVTTDTEWSSEWIGLSYTLGDGYTFASHEEINSMMELSADVFLVDESGNPLYDYSKLNVIYEMMAYDASGSNLIIMCEANQMNLSEAQYFAAMKRQLKQADMEYVFSDLTEVTIGDVTMRKTQAYTDDYGIRMYQIYLVRVYGDRVISIIASSSNEAAAQALIDSIR